MDKVTQDRIKLLHPKIRNEVTKIIEECNSKLTQHSQVRIVQGLRTVEEQNALYAKGRTKPGPKVTNAKGLDSNHVFGIALDFCLLIDNKEISWDLNKDFDKDNVPDWSEVRDIFKKYGYEWGGNWKSIKDYPHFQKTFGYSEKQLLNKYNKKDFIAGTT
mgnify:CR=1 FL=1